MKPAPTCRDGEYACLDVGETPLLNNIRRGLIDPDTPQEAMTKINADGREWKLVVSLIRAGGTRRDHQANLHIKFSDEFNMPGRTFYDEDDPFFQAVDLWYGVTMDKEVCARFAHFQK